MGIAMNDKEALKSLAEVRAKISNLFTEIIAVELRKDLIKETQEDLKNEISSIDRNQIKDLYRNIRKSHLGVGRSFKGLINFHDQMVKRKIAYITKGLPSLKEEINKKESELKTLLQEADHLKKSLRKMGNENFM